MLTSSEFIANTIDFKQDQEGIELFFNVIVNMEEYINSPLMEQWTITGSLVPGTIL